MVVSSPPLAKAPPRTVHERVLQQVYQAVEGSSKRSKDAPPQPREGRFAWVGLAKTRGQIPCEGLREGGGISPSSKERRRGLGLDLLEHPRSVRATQGSVRIEAVGKAL